MSELDELGSAEAEFNSHVARQRKSVLLMVSFICVAVGALVAMRTQPPDEAGAVIAVDSGSPWVLPEVSPDEMSVIDVIMMPPPAQRETPRDPFPRENNPEPSSGLTARESRLRDIEAAAALIPLQTIMSGPNPLARVNGKVVRPGTVVRVSLSTSKVRVDFRVESISDRGVVLVVEEPELGIRFETTLRMTH